MSADPATIAFYEKQAPHYTMSFGQAPHRHLDAFLDRLQPGARILELGCGGGQDSARIIERGFDLDATDGVEAMARKANERFNVGARVMQFQDLSAVAVYDAVWAHACLLHAARADLPGILAAIHRSLRPGGWHFANYKLGDGEGRDLLGRLHNFPDESWITRAYETAGFTITAQEVYPGKAADGTQRDWIALTCQRDAL
ncbi:class I SAM-dependent DNA methyltransferase [Parerythrobacter jejuensis]|uniref:Methyltransferase domain-containing protein n=1 Tax=Parerythrobacter jejuensis TaxID=795812 RepID=A0A845ATJ1_9SPHN|nr:class I SAM-dependent methyltransferase [Parerythrobacter jejuensis]MXP32677.1 methyltransferase domain-containing protein [Parerythrobacter jejuensis]